MTARAGMANLIIQVRGLANAGTLDYTANDDTYWSDDQLQTILDRHRVEVYREPLQMYPTYTGGTVTFQEYRSQYINLEQVTGGTPDTFALVDATGNTQGTSLWAADYGRGIVTFTANTQGTAYFLTGRAYDLYATAADVWRSKAAYFAGLFDFSTDNHSISRSQLYKNAMAQAERMDGLSGANGSNVVTMYRSDVQPYNYSPWEPHRPYPHNTP